MSAGEENNRVGVDLFFFVPLEMALFPYGFDASLKHQRQLRVTKIGTLKGYFFCRPAKKIIETDIRILLLFSIVLAHQRQFRVTKNGTLNGDFDFGRDRF